jgi:hypothetical protein
MAILSFFKGTVSKLDEYGPAPYGGQKLISPMQLLTPNGPIDLDMTDTWYPEVKVGDFVECDEGRGWFYNGRLVSYPDKGVIINGVLYKEPPR